ncbi:MAG: sulfatase-like hydrolase/transferase [Chitinophagales bacterium]
MIVADSLRFDSCYQPGPGVPYLEQNAAQFINARSSGCWTLPATSCLFTGLLPHEHGATSQSRWLKNEVPSLPEKLKTAGYKTIQVTANMVTTDIFNVAKGFDEVHKTWQFVDTRHPWLLRMVLSANRLRIRRMFLKPKDIVFDKLSEDLRQGIIWAQKTAQDAFIKAKQLIDENNAKGQPVFMFINLMETHYPYHIADTFTLLSKGLLNKFHEWQVLYHYLSQSFLKKDNSFITQADLELLREKQKLSWKLIRDDVDLFCKEMHQGKDNLMIFCSDHGDNFGEQGWQYHFSNVTDGGNRVPMFWLDHENPKGETKNYNVSSRFVHYDIVRAAGIHENDNTILQERENNLPVLQSFWYDNEGHTMDKYKYNQMAFIEGDKRFVLRAGKWMYAPVKGAGLEPTFEFVEHGFNPLEAINLPAERKKYLEENIRNFSAFSEKIMNKGK